MSLPILLAAGIGFVLFLASIRFVFRFLVIPSALALGIFFLLGSGTHLVGHLASAPYVHSGVAPTTGRRVHAPGSAPAQPLVSAFLAGLRSATAGIRHAIRVSATSAPHSGGAGTHRATPTGGHPERAP